jgi:vacuolar-type H+-ATPase subunit H
MTASAQPELPPLDQIRLAEAQVIRRLAAARQASESVIAEAQSYAAALKREAARAGRRDGEAYCRQAISAAEEEAGRLLAEARRRAEELRCAGGERHPAAVAMILAAVLGEDEEPAGE